MFPSCIGQSNCESSNSILTDNLETYLQENSSLFQQRNNNEYYNFLNQILFGYYFQLFSSCPQIDNLTWDNLSDLKNHHCFKDPSFSHSQFNSFENQLNSPQHGNSTLNNQMNFWVANPYFISVKPLQTGLLSPQTLNQMLFSYNWMQLYNNSCGEKYQTLTGNIRGTKSDSISKQNFEDSYRNELDVIQLNKVKEKEEFTSTPGMKATELSPEGKSVESPAARDTANRPVKKALSARRRWKKKRDTCEFCGKIFKVKIEIVFKIIIFNSIFSHNLSAIISIYTNSFLFKHQLV